VRFGVSWTAACNQLRNLDLIRRDLVTSIAFDATAPINFARAGRVNELLAACGDDEPVLLAEVATELARGALPRPSLDASSEARLKLISLQHMPELAAFASYKSELGGGHKETAARLPCSDG